MIRILCLNISQADDGQYQALYAMASEERRARADRCREREAALRCLAAEALLRLAVCRDLPGQMVTVCRDEFGKPYLKNQPEFSFNLSHSGPWVVLAWGERVGIDVEAPREGHKWQQLSRRFFTPGEQAFLFRGEEVQGQQRFLAIWTAKESYLKYLGTGLRTPLNSFDVLVMEEPRFFRQILSDGSCMTLCAREEARETAFLDLDALLSELTGKSE